MSTPLDLAAEKEDAAGEPFPDGAGDTGLVVSCSGSNTPGRWVDGPGGKHLVRETSTEEDEYTSTGIPVDLATPDGEDDAATLAPWAHVLRERAISLDAAYRAGIRGFRPLAKTRRLKGDAWTRLTGLPFIEGVSGIVIPYHDEYGLPAKYFRARVDDIETTKSEHNPKGMRYLSPSGQKVVPYILREVWQLADDPGKPIAIVEAPLKALSLTSNGIAAIGLGGAQAGAHVREGGVLAAHPLLKNINWKGRTCNIIYDATIQTKASVAHGAAMVAKVLGDLGAKVKVVRLPMHHKSEQADLDDPTYKTYREEDQGPDDYIFRHGAKALTELISSAEEGDPCDRLAQVWGQVSAKADKVKALTGLTKDLYWLACLHVGGEMVLKQVAAMTSTVGVSIRSLRDLMAPFRADLTSGLGDGDNNPYEVIKHQFHRKGEESPLCNFFGWISAQSLRDDGESKTVIYHVNGTFADGTPLPMAKVPANEFSSLDWLRSNWPQCVIAPGKPVRDYVRHAIETWKDPAKRTTTTTYTHMGWRTINGKRTYVMPGGGVCETGKVDLECDVDIRGFGLEFPETMEEMQAGWKASTELLRLDPSVMASVLGAVYLAPLSQIIPDGCDFSLWVQGPSGSMKSTLLALAQSHWGEFGYTGLPANLEQDTSNALRAKQARIGGAILGHDNNIPHSMSAAQARSTSQLESIIQAIGDQAGRSRANRDGSLRKADPGPKCMAVFSSELPPPGTGESTWGRCFVVERRPGIDLVALTAAQANTRALRHAMAGYLHWLATNHELVTDFVRSEFTRHRKIEGGWHGRHQGAYAKLATALNVWGNYGKSLGFANASEVITRAVEALQLNLRSQVAPATRKPVDLFWDTLCSMLRAGKIALADSPAGSLTGIVDKVGWIDKNTVLLEPDATYQAVTKHLGPRWVHNESVLRFQLRDHKVEVGSETVPVIAQVDGKHLAVKKTVGGARLRVWVVDRQTLLQGDGRASDKEPGLEDYSAYN